MVTAELRAALERALAEAEADERIAPAMCARGVRLRFVFTDVGLQLNVSGSPENQELEWSFGEVSWEPKLTLEMDSEVANRFLLGQESLAIALARGQVRVRGDSRSALWYLPATRLISEPYRRVVQSAFPALAV
jgi:hypothetical protein